MSKLPGSPRKIGNPPREMGKLLAFFGFFRSMEKMAWDGPKWGREDFFPTNPGLANILGRMDLDFENFYFFHFLDPKFLDFQVPHPGWIAARAKKLKKYKLSKSKYGLPKMLARSGLVGNKSSWPHLGQFHVFFPWAGICLQFCLFTRFGPLLLST